MVANIVMSYNVSETVSVAALLHDVLEDTEVTVAEVQAVAGDLDYRLLRRYQRIKRYRGKSVRQPTCTRL